MPDSQSSASRPCAPTGWTSASAVRYSWTDSPELAASLPVAVGHEVVREPAEDVADPGLACLVAVQPSDDPAVHHAAHARDLGQRLGVHHVAGRGAHDREHLPRLDRAGGGRGHVRVDVADGDRDPLGQPGPGRRLRAEGSRGLAQLADPVRELALGEVGEVRVERGQEVGVRVAPVLVDPLVPGRAGVAQVAAGELPDDPVGRLDPVIHPVVELGVLLEQLQRLRELPLRGDQPAVARQPALRPLGGEGVDPVRLRLGRVVLPQLHVGVRAVRRTRAPRTAASRRRRREGSCTR